MSMQLMSAIQWNSRFVHPCPTETTKHGLLTTVCNVVSFICTLFNFVVFQEPTGCSSRHCSCSLLIGDDVSNWKIGGVTGIL